MKHWFKPSTTAVPPAKPALRPTGQPTLALMIPLEPRIMFDAAAGSTVAVAAEAAHADVAHAAPDTAHAADHSEASRIVIAPAVAEARHEIVFVDTRVPNYQKLVDAVAPGVDVVLLDTHSDGVQQIADALATRHDIDAVHIISHGDDGLLLLGSGPLFNGNVDRYTGQLATIGHALKADGDIRLYGCDVGAGTEGAAFLAKLADVTGADIAASTDGTGTAARGGNWDLEVSTGTIGTSQALDATQLAAYNDLLVTTVVSSVSALKSAIATGNTDGVDDVITLTGNITFASAADTITINVTDGHTMSIAGAGYTLSGNNLTQVLNVSTSGAGSAVAIDHLTITNGFLTGAGGNTPGNSAGLAGGDALGAGIRNAGALTISDSTITANKAAGGGGGGGGAASGGGAGGGGGGFGTTPGGAGGSNNGISGNAGTAGTGGTGAGFTNMGGRGGSTTGGAGATYGGTYTNGGNGATANNGSISIGGGGGGAGYNYAGGRGGNAAAAVYNTGTLTIVRSSITGNIAAGGGGGGGAYGAHSGSGGNAGSGIAGIWNPSGTVNLDATTNASLSTGNTGVAGSVGISPASGNGSTGSSGTTLGTLNTSYNAPPAVAGLAGDSISYTEGGSATLLDSGSNATLTDSDSADLSGGNVTASIVTNRVSGEDVLGVRNEGTGAGQIGVSGSNVTYGGVTIGTLAGGSGTNDLVITLNASATPTAVQALVRNLTYSNSNGTEPASLARTVRVTVNDGDGGGNSNSSDISVSVVAVNDAPTLSSTGGTPTFTENGSAVTLFSGTSVATVESGQTITSLTFTVSNVSDGANEIIATDGSTFALTNGNSGTTATNSVSYSVSVSAGTATVTLTKAGGLSTAATQTLVNGMTYRNSSEAPTTTNRVVTLTSIQDNGGTANGGVDTTSLSVSSTVSVVAVNDAPTLSGGPYALTGTTEDTTTAGTLVSTLLAGLTYADVDASASSGIAITAGTGNGTWQYSTDGVTWNGVGSVSASAALLLTSGTRLRYVPDATNGETATLTFRAWDQTSGIASTNATRNTADTGTNGGTTAFSNGTAQASLTVTSVNDAPVLTPASPTLTGLTDSDINNAGQTVASIIGSSITDVDSGAVQGIAVTGLVSGTGTWQYSTNGGSSWSNVGTVTSASALLLRSADLVRFVPDGVTGTTGSLSYVGWDQTGATAGQQGTKVNAGSTGGSTPFSSASDTASITVTAVNDAPSVVTSGGSAAFVEADGTSSTPVVIDSGLLVADSDSPTLASATVTITGNFQSAQDVLAFSNDGATMGNITASYTSGTGVLTLSSAGGSATLAQWQAALRSVTYSNGSDTPNTATRTISFVTNDGGLDSVAATRSVTVTAVNDTPVNGVPAAQTMRQDQSLVFSSGNGNLISVSDVDLGGSSLQITLTATHGLLSLSGTSGLVFFVGTGTGDATMTFTGTAADANTALAGLSFTPTTGYNGAATLQITSNDQGATGPGGAKTDTDAIAITVSPLNPTVTTVQAASSNGGYKVGDTVLVTVTFDMDVNVDTSGGTPTLLLETGSIDRNAIYLSGSGTNTLAFAYTVQAGDSSGDLDAASTAALALNGATIRSTGGDAAVLTLPTLGGANSLAGQSALVIDGIAPTVTAVAVPASGTYVAGQHQDFSVNLSEAVVVDTSGGTPRLAVTLDTGGTVYADYLSGSGSGTLVFRLTVASGQLDSNGITLGSTLDLNGGTVRDAVGNDAVATLNSVGATTGVLVDAIVPTVASVGVPAAGTYKAGDVLSFTVNTSEAVIIDTSGGTPRLALDIGGSTVYASYVSGSGGSALQFRYTVQTGDTDADGIAVGSLQANGGTLRDAAGNALTLTLNSVASTAAVRVDTTAPTPVSIVRVNPTPTAAGSLGFTVSFSEDVTGVDATDFTLAATGSASGSITGVTQVDAHTYTVQLGNVAGTGNLQLNLKGSATGIVDVAGNAINGGLAGAAYAVDRDVPVVISVSVPANATYVAGQNLDFSVSLSEAVVVDTSGGTPRLAVTLDTGGTVYADYLSGSGSGTLVFRLTVASGQLDSNGITLGSTLDLNGGTVRDAVGNDAVATLNSVGATTGVLVDAIVPTVASVGVPAAGTYKAGDVLSFTVNTSEAVIIDTSGGTPRLALDIGGSTVYASYVSGSGGSALQFRYTVQAGDTDADGIAVGSLQANGGTLRDAAGNNMALPLNSVASTAAVRVDTTAPTPASIVRVNPTPTAAGSLGFTVSFSEDVTGVDATDFTLAATGSASGSITGVTQVDAHTYTVQLGNVAGTGNLQLNLKGSATGIVDVAGNAINGGLAGEAYAVDRDAPAVTAVAVPASGTYVAGQHLDFSVNLSEAVVVDTSGGTPRLAVTLDTGGTIYADYLSGSGSGTLVFRLTVASGQLDSNGITLGSTLDLNGGTVRDAVGNDAVATLNSVGATTGVLVDAIVPTVASVGVPAVGTYKAGDVLSFTVNTSEAVIIDTSGGTPRLALDIGGSTVYASYVSGSGGSALQFRYTVQTGDTDADGIAVGSLQANGGTLRDAAGNALTLTLNSVASTTAVRVDTTAPTPVSIVRVNPTPTAAGSLGFTVSFSEDVSGVDATDFTLAATGSASGSITGVTQVDAHTYTVQLGNVAGTGNLQLNLKGSATGIVDVAGNVLSGGLAGEAYAVDRVVPTVTSIKLPTDGTYGIGDTLDFSLQLSEAVRIDTGAGTPRLVIQLQNGGQAFADYVGSTGTDTLNFRYTVLPGQVALQGITITGYEARGAVVQDLTGNPMTTTLPAADGQGVHVNAALPIALPPAPSPVAPPPPITPTFTSSLPIYTVDTSTTTSPTAVGLGPLGTGIYTFRADAPPALTTVAQPPQPYLPLTVDTSRNDVVASRPDFVLPSSSGFVRLTSQGSTRESSLQTAIPNMGTVTLSTDRSINFAIPAGTFTSSDGSSPIVLTARMANGQALPSWLRFDPVTGTLSGKAPPGLSGELAIRVIARDAAGHEVVSTIKLSTQTPDKPRSSSEAPPTPDARPLAALLGQLGMPAESAAPPQGRLSLTGQFELLARQHRQPDTARLLHQLQQQAEQQESRPVEPA
ncbi:DUF4347 domain-containing protein [Pelomonas nitida]|uniref:DUF4347 domain-containing protein n=1 Tax=Pelomonas nitida TaxID=3299027 RepID=A0ABW7G3E7_9BURK